MRVDIWSDLVCPWCYIGKRRFERVLSGLEDRGRVEIVHRSFELNPGAPRGVPSDRREMLRRKYGWSDAQADAVDARLMAIAADEGLEYRLAGGLTGNTLEAHQVVHLAAARGLQDAVVERLLRAHFTEQRSIFHRDSLVELAGEAGLPASDVRAALEEQTYAAAVARDEAEARALGVTGVPFFLVDGHFAISGAQPPEVFVEALTRARESRPSAS